MIVRMTKWCILHFEIPTLVNEVSLHSYLIVRVSMGGYEFGRVLAPCHIAHLWARVDALHRLTRKSVQESASERWVSLPLWWIRMILSFNSFDIPVRKKYKTNAEICVWPETSIGRSSSRHEQTVVVGRPRKRLQINFCKNIFSNI